MEIVKLIHPRLIEACLPLIEQGHYDDAAVVLEAVYMLEPTNSNGYECAKALRLAGREADANKLLARMAQAESA